jgi:hypothetical protein
MDTSVYSEAKGEYTKQLSQFIVPAFHRFFMETLNFAQQEEQNSKRQLWKFQELLSQIPEWNIDKVQRETGKLIQDIQCDYLEELLTAVFIAHTKVLTAIRIGNKNKRVQITVPKMDHFLHRALTESSRQLWSSVYLFHNELSPIEKQKNHRQIEQLLYEGVSQAIRGLLPVKNILKDYLAEPEHDADTDAEDDEDDEKEEDKDEKHIEKNIKPVEPAKKESVFEPLPAPMMEPEPISEPTPESVVESAPAPTLEPVSHSTIQVEKFENSIQPTNPPTEVSEISELPKIDISESVNTSSDTSIKESIAQILPDEDKKTIDEHPVPAPVQSNEESTLYKSISNTLNTITNTFLPKESNESTSPTTPTLIVATDNSVQFTNFDQVIQQRGNKTHIDYIEKERMDVEDSDQIYFMGEETEPFSDFEELMDQPPETLDTNDFETIA